MTRTFTFDGATVTQEDLLAANRDDAALCEWLAVAEVGETFPGTDLRRLA